MTVLAMLLAVTSGFADQQTDYIQQIRDKGPQADFSQMDMSSLSALADADAMVYSADHPKKLDLMGLYYVGKAHAFKHHLIGGAASYYGTSFSSTLETLQKDTD
jgi:hypothetical protein